MHKRTQLLARYETLTAELGRRRNGMPAKAFAVVSSVLALLSVGLSAGLASPLFVVPAVALALFLIGFGINSWGFRRNLQDTKNALSQLS